jgi:hypothetical protein
MPDRSPSLPDMQGQVACLEGRRHPPAYPVYVPEAGQDLVSDQHVAIDPATIGQGFYRRQRSEHADRAEKGDQDVWLATRDRCPERGGGHPVGVAHQSDGPHEKGRLVQNPGRSALHG